eukprot:2706248-Pyramimonas_sp.AAC.1
MRAKACSQMKAFLGLYGISLENPLGRLADALVGSGKLFIHVSLPTVKLQLAQSLTELGPKLFLQQFDLVKRWRAMPRCLRRASPSKPGAYWDVVIRLARRVNMVLYLYLSNSIKVEFVRGYAIDPAGRPPLVGDAGAIVVWAKKSVNRSGPKK